jgi:predicted nucleic acid-binding protein
VKLRPLLGRGFAHSNTSSRHKCLISSLVRSEGITRVNITILLHDATQKVVAPAELIQELRAHTNEFCRKSSITLQHLERALNQLLENVELVQLSAYRSKLHEAVQFVRDESDAPFAALALARSSSIIITYDKRHFNSKRLLRRGVRVLTPVDVVKGENVFDTMRRTSQKDLRSHRDLK